MKNTIVIYCKYYSVFEPYYSKVYYTVYIIVFNTLLMNATAAYCSITIVNW